MTLRRMMALVVAASLFVLAGCGGGAKDTKSTDKPAADTKKTDTASKEPIVLGGWTYLSGDPAVIDQGKQIIAAAELAVEEVNKAGGVLGRQLKLDWYDENMKPEEVVPKIEASKPFATFGFATSGNALSLYQELVKQKRILMITGASATELTDAVAKDPQTYRYLFRNGPHVRDGARLGVLWSKEFMKAKNYLYVGVDLAVAKSMGTAVEELMKPEGITSVGTVLIDLEKPDFSAVAKAVAEKKPDVMLTYVGPLYPAFAPFLVENKINVPIFEIPSNFVDNQTAVKKTFGDKAEAMNYISGQIPMQELPVTSKTKPFYASLRTKTGKEPLGLYDLRMADAVFILADAIKQAGAADTDKVISVLEKRTFTGVSGNFEFDSSHQAKWGRKYASGLIGQWQDGKLVVVWPDDTKTGDWKPSPLWKK